MSRNARENLSTLKPHCKFSCMPPMKSSIAIVEHQLIELFTQKMSINTLSSHVSAPLCLKPERRAQPYTVLYIAFLQTTQRSAFCAEPKEDWKDAPPEKCGSVKLLYKRATPACLHRSSGLRAVLASHLGHAPTVVDAGDGGLSSRLMANGIAYTRVDAKVGRRTPEAPCCKRQSMACKSPVQIRP